MIECVLVWNDLLHFRCCDHRRTWHSFSFWYIFTPFRLAITMLPMTLSQIDGELKCSVLQHTRREYVGEFLPVSKVPLYQPSTNPLPTLYQPSTNSLPLPTNVFFSRCHYCCSAGAQTWEKPRTDPRQKNIPDVISHKEIMYNITLRY